MDASSPAVPLVRPLDPDDAEAWARFVGVERARTYAGLMREDFEAQQLAHAPAVAAEVRAELAAGVGRVAVAWQGDAIVGAASTTSSPMAWELALGLEATSAGRALDTLYVAPSQHGTGLADRLLALVLDDEPTMLWLILGNERARRFYERRGFVPWGAEVSAGWSWNHVPMRRMLRAGAAPARG